jgi:hypothetical protein
MNFHQEIEKHLGWIEGVVSLVSGRNISNENIEEISRGDLCALGRWLDSEEAGNAKNPAVFHELKESHQAFHTLAGNLVDALRIGDEAELLRYQDIFFETSRKVIDCLNLLQDDSGAVASS